MILDLAVVFFFFLDSGVIFVLFCFFVRDAAGTSRSLRLHARPVASGGPVLSSQGNGSLTPSTNWTRFTFGGASANTNLSNRGASVR